MNMASCCLITSLLKIQNWGFWAFLLINFFCFSAASLASQLRPINIYLHSFPSFLFCLYSIAFLCIVFGCLSKKLKHDEKKGLRRSQLPHLICSDSFRLVIRCFAAFFSLSLSSFIRSLFCISTTGASFDLIANNVNNIQPFFRHGFPASSINVARIFSYLIFFLLDFSQCRHNPSFMVCVFFLPILIFTDFSLFPSPNNQKWRWWITKTKKNSGRDWTKWFYVLLEWTYTLNIKHFEKIPLLIGIWAWISMYLSCINCRFNI